MAPGTTESKESEVVLHLSSIPVVDILRQPGTGTNRTSYTFRTLTVPLESSV